MRDAYLFSIVMNIIKFQIRLIKMKKRFALAAAFAFSMIPFTSSAGHLQMEADHPEFQLLLMTGELSHRDLEGKYLDTLYRLGLFTPLGADLSYANLKDADLEGLSLVNADFTGAILVGTNLSNANLARATLNTVISSLTDLKNVNLTGADLSAALLGDDLDGFADIKSCPGKMPSGWYCQNKTFKKIEDIDFNSISRNVLPYSVYCPSKDKYLKIKLNKKTDEIVVRFAKGKKFYDGSKFDEALEEFEETYDNKCV